MAISCLLIATNADAACRENDLGCFREGFLERGKQIDSLAREIASKDQLLASKDQQITVLTSTMQEQATALTDARGAIKHAERSWVEDPRLWFGAGVGVGILTVALTAVALHYTLH